VGGVQRENSPPDCFLIRFAAASSFGVIEAALDGCITRFLEKPAKAPGLPDRPGEALVSLGIFVFDWEVLRAAVLRDTRDINSSHDSGYDILPRLIAGHPVFAHALTAPERSSGTGFRCDVGSLDAYRQIQIDMTRPDHAFLAHDPARQVHPRPEARTQRCQFSGNFVLPQARVVPDAVLEGCVIVDNATIGGGARLRNAIVMADVDVPAQFKAGWGTRSDAARFICSSRGTVLIAAARLAEFTKDRQRVSGLSGPGQSSAYQHV